MSNVIVNIEKWCIIINVLFLLLLFCVVYFVGFFLGLLFVDYKYSEIDRKRKLDWKTQNPRAYFEKLEFIKNFNTTYMKELTIPSFLAFRWTITIFHVLLLS